MNHNYHNTVLYISKLCFFLQMAHEKSGPGLSSISPDRSRRYLQKVSWFLYFNSERAYSLYCWSRALFLREELQPTIILLFPIVFVADLFFSFSSSEIASKKIIILGIIRSVFLFFLFFLFLRISLLSFCLWKMRTFFSWNKYPKVISRIDKGVKRI